MRFIDRLKIALGNGLARLVPWTIDLPEHLKTDCPSPPGEARPRPLLTVIEGGKAIGARPSYPRSCRDISAASRRIG